jgi:hypothetical protein
MCKNPCGAFELWVEGYLKKFRTRDIPGGPDPIIVRQLSKALRAGTAELADNEWGYNVINESM